MATDPAETAKIVTVAGGLYVRQAIDNTAWVDMGDWAIVVDALEQPGLAGEVFAAIQSTLGDKPVRYLLNTHTHYDHMALNGAFQRRMGTEIISTQDRSVRMYFAFQRHMDDPWRRRFFYLSFERSYKLLKGDFKYFMVEAVYKISRPITSFLHYQGTIRYRGNLTPQDSPLIFLGGRTNLIGYDNDEFWGRRVFYHQNLFQLLPFPEFTFRIHHAEFRRIALHFQYDLGQVRGFSRLKDLKPQDSDLKMGYGVGLGINTDFPFMPGTKVHFLLASPTKSSRGYKFYAGFGGWIN